MRVVHVGVDHDVSLSPSLSPSHSPLHPTHCISMQHIDPLFVCFLESLSQFYSSSSEHLSTLVGHREVASFLSETNSEITMQWLSAAQVRGGCEGEGRV